MTRQDTSLPGGAPVSIVIPVLNAADTIGPCLGALAEAAIDGLIREVILVDGGSSDAIAEVADVVGAELVTSAPGRGIQLAEGARQARGSWLMFVHADSVLDEGWAGVVHQHLAKHWDRAGYFQLRFASSHPMARVTAGWANLRARVLGLPYGDQGLLVSRRLYDEVGGYPEIALMEDVALARRLKGRLWALPCGMETSPDKYVRDGWISRGASNLWRLVRYLAGARPETLARGYGR